MYLSTLYLIGCRFCFAFGEILDISGDMDSHGQETLRRVEENDAELTTLWIRDGMFISRDGDDFSRLGAAIGENMVLI